MKHVAALILTTLVAGSGIAAADVQYVVPERGDSVRENADPVMVEPTEPGQFRDVMKLVGTRESRGLEKFKQKTVNSHVLFLNNCQPNGCQVKASVDGTDDNTQDISGAAAKNGVLSAYPSDGTWPTVLQCVKDTMSRFNITVTDVDPGSAPHFEEMVAGTPGQVGLDSGTGGIASVPCNQPGQCEDYNMNALVFTFAGASFVKSGGPLFICSVAAQEIAHAWILDHVVEKTDPMTYNMYTGMHQYQDNMKCGSDCQGGVSPFGLSCTGSGGNATHACMVSGNSVTQNDVQMITALFGSSNATKPTVAITSPSNGATVGPTFDVTATCTVSDSTVQQVDIYVDGTLGRSLVSSPYTFSATLSPGTHKLTATCTTAAQAQASADITVNVGSSSGCTDAASCPNKGDVCVMGACVAGATTPGGFGATCTNNGDCSSSLCASDGSNSYCVITCTLGADNACPAGYTCTNAGTMGVCFPGGGDGGGCSTSGDSAPAFLGLGGFVALVIRRRRSRK